MEDVKKGEDNRMCSGLVTGLTGSAQDLNENDVIDSGFAGVFAEYDAEQLDCILHDGCGKIYIQSVQIFF